MERVEDQIRKTAEAVTIFKSENMFNVSLGQTMFIFDYLSIDHDLDEKLEYNVIYRKDRG